MARELSRFLLLVLAALALHGPGLGRAELENEEGRRAIPAREMLASGDVVLPTLFGEPYLAKPPAYFWAVAGSARLLEGLGLPSKREPGEPGWYPSEHGPVSPLAVRLPSLLAAIVGALALAVAGRALGSPAAGTWAAAFWLLAPNLARKVRLGEIETALAAACFLAGGLLWWAARGPRVRVVPVLFGGLFTALAVLLKGPIALLFALWPPIVGAGPGRPRRAIFVPGAALLVAAGVSTLWLVPLFGRFPDRADVLALWSGEIARDPEPGLWPYLLDRWRLASGSLLGWLPAAGFLIYGLARRRSLPWMRGPLLALLLPAIVLGLWPGVRARYAMPMLPWIALAAGGVAAEWVERRRAAGLVPYVPWLRVAAVVLLLARGVQLFATEPARFDRDRRVETAGVIDGLANGVLWVDRTRSFNTLFYLRSRIRAIEAPGDVPTGGLLLRGAAAAELDDGRWERVEIPQPTPELAVMDLWLRR